MNLPVLTCDMETYYDTEYSLSKMQTDAYVLDARFEVILVVVVCRGRAMRFSGTMEETRTWLQKFPWHECAALAHNTLFDGFILTQVFGIKPKMWLDTLSMARAVYPYLPSHSLGAVGKYMGCSYAKGDEVSNMKGRHRLDLTPLELQRYGNYCENDALMAEWIYDKLERQFPALELEMIDNRIRMFTEPMFHLDGARLRAYYDNITAMKKALLVLGDIEKSEVMSNDKFAAALEALGVSPPLKKSKTTGKLTYAFAKTDEEMTDLLEHPDSRVQLLVNARLKNKSTIAETRALKFIETADRGRGWPVYINYWGAKTTGRDSGGNKINALNLPNRGADREIRQSILAPPGFVIVVGDSANIELRVNFVLNGQFDLVDKIRMYDAQGKAATSDLYCDFASAIFGKTVTKSDEKDRFVGKTGELGLGYGCGTTTFGNMLRVQGNLRLDENELRRIIDVYRATHQEVARGWKRLDRVVLPAIAERRAGVPVDVHGWFTTNTDWGFSLPGQLGVQYHNLSMTDDGWKYQQGKLWPYLYGGKMDENLCVDGDALVLTNTGWVPLKYITTERVHDGVEFVRHGGKVNKGFKECVTVDGVMMTPDHEVLTNEGWKAALDQPRPYRPDLRHVDCCPPVGVRREEDALAVPVYMREAVPESWVGRDQGSEAWRDAELRVSHERVDECEVSHARYVRPPGVRGVPQHDRSVQSSVAPGVEELRRSWYHRMRAVAERVRVFLGRHGADLQARADAGPVGQQQGVLSEELRVEDLLQADAEQAKQHRCRSSENSHGNRGAAVDSVLQVRSKTATREVYDLMDCGPRNRFVVLGNDGPFIVHNCQHAARMIVMAQAARTNLKYPVKLVVYDEIVCVVPEDQAEDCKAWMKECLQWAPKWCRDVLPLNGSVDYGMSYGEAK